MKTDEYLELVTEQIRSRIARDPIREELYVHMLDQKEAYMDEGMSEEEAERETIQGMGNPVKIGEEFDRIHRPQMPWRMICLIILISLVGYLLQIAVIETHGGFDAEFLDYKKELKHEILFKNKLKTDIENLFDEYDLFSGLRSISFRVG